MAELAVLMVNYKSPAYTIDCLASLEKERAAGPDFEVWLLDNASGDNSVELIQHALSERDWKSWVHFVQSNINYGFAGGNNHLLDLARKEDAAFRFVLLLNNDTLVHPGCLSYMLKRLKEEPSISLMSCQLLNADGSIQNVARKLPTPLRETLRALGLPYALPVLFGWADLEDAGWDRATETRDVEWVGGACMCMTRETAENTGLFDTDFFFYGEDMELCYRIQKNGGRVVFDPGASITHFGGASSDPTRLQDRRRNILYWRARFMVQKKCYGAVGAAWSRLAYITGFFLRKCWLILRGRKRTETYKSISGGLWELTHLSTDEAA